MPRAHLAVIGAGIVGLATALEFVRRYPDAEVTVLEKEAQIAAHQTSHNSGVIHSGIYYKPGSLKARLCRAGSQEMIRFCEEHGIPFRITGKIIVATKLSELQKLDELYQRGLANGLSGLRMLSPTEITEREPHAAGLRAIHVPQAGIVDYGQVARMMAHLLEQRGGKIRCRAAVLGLCEGAGEVTLDTTQGNFMASYVVNCAGLQSDYVGRMAGSWDEIRIIPFRGEYYEVVPERRSLVRGLIYPVPDPRFPFLGVHFTRRIGGAVDAGPNAVFAFRRTGYRRRDISVRDLGIALLFPGFWKMAERHWQSAAGEYYRSLWKPAFVSALQRLVPEIRSSDLVPGGSGVRAQALRRDGFLIDDFQFEETTRLLHVYNVPSPAATASLAIARELVTRIAAQMFLDPERAQKN